LPDGKEVKITAGGQNDLIKQIAERNKTARFWKYDGKHHSSRDCEHHNPHNFELSLNYPVPFTPL